MSYDDPETLRTLAAMRLYSGVPLHPQEYDALKAVLEPPAPEPPKPPSPKEMAQLLFAYATARMVSFMAVAGMTSSDQQVPVQNKRLRGWGQ